jgi:carbon monoxide dehydrogenase subunit G
MRLEQTFEIQAPLAHVWTALNDLERVAPCLPGATITSHDDDGTYRGTFTVKLGPMTAVYDGTIKIEDVDEAAHRATLKARGADKRGQGGAHATIVNTLSEHGGGTRVEAVTDFTITGRLAQFGRGGMLEDISNRLMRDFASCLSTRLAEGPPAVEDVPSGAEVAAGHAAPEEVAAAATAPPGTPPPTPATPPDERSATPPEEPSATPPPAATPPPTAPAAQPLKGGSLFFGVLWDRIKRLFRRG